MNETRVPVRTEKEILRLAQRSRNVTQEVIASKLNIKRNALNQNMNRTRMSLETFIKVLNALDYDVMVVDREKGEPEWQLFVARDVEEDDI